MIKFKLLFITLIVVVSSTVSFCTSISDDLESELGKCAISAKHIYDYCEVLDRESVISEDIIISEDTTEKVLCKFIRMDSGRERYREDIKFGTVPKQTWTQWWNDINPDPIHDFSHHPLTDPFREMEKTHFGSIQFGDETDARKILISFRGTIFPDVGLGTDIKTNLDLREEDIAKFHNERVEMRYIRRFFDVGDGIQESDIKVHRGFLLKALSGQEEMFRHIESYITHYTSHRRGTIASSRRGVPLPPDKFCFTLTGHSLGGALATILTASLKNYLDTRRIFYDLKLVTFGSPAVFSEEATRIFNNKIRTIRRVLYSLTLQDGVEKARPDTVTRCCREVLGTLYPYVHVGEEKVEERRIDLKETHISTKVAENYGELIKIIGVSLVEAHKKGHNIDSYCEALRARKSLLTSRK